MKFATRTNKVRNTECGIRNVALQGVTSRSFRTPHSALRTSGFTLAEVLAALLFLAIVIPVAVEALHISSLAGQLAARKGQAAHIADRILNESLVTTNWSRGTQTGTISEGTLDFQYKLSTEIWPQDAMQQIGR